MLCKLNAMGLLSIHENFHHTIFNPRALQTYNFKININIFQTADFKSIRQSFMFYFRT